MLRLLESIQNFVHGPATVRTRKAAQRGRRFGMERLEDRCMMAGLSVADVSVAEWAGEAVLTIVNGTAKAEEITVEYRTVEGTAQDGSDYTGVSGTLVFEPWETAKTVRVPITDDSVAENAETFTLELFNPVNTGIDDAQAVVTIRKNDHAPVITITGAEEGPGDYWTFSGTVTDADEDPAGFTVTFGGILASYGYTATVEADGTFYLTAEFPGLIDGTVTAQTTDSDGLDSNLAQYYVDA